MRKEDHHAALQKARLREETPEFAQTYAQRAGIEGTLSQSIRRCDIRHNRYRGMAKTHLQHILIGVALNFVRAGEWLLEKPQAKTRTSAFQAVMCAA